MVCVAEFTPREEKTSATGVPRFAPLAVPPVCKPFLPRRARRQTQRYTLATRDPVKPNQTKPNRVEKDRQDTREKRNKRASRGRKRKAYWIVSCTRCPVQKTSGRLLSIKKSCQISIGRSHTTRRGGGDAEGACGKSTRLRSHQCTCTTSFVFIVVTPPSPPRPSVRPAPKTKKNATAKCGKTHGGIEGKTTKKQPRNREEIRRNSWRNRGEDNKMQPRNRGETWRIGRETALEYSFLPPPVHPPSRRNYQSTNKKINSSSSPPLQ